MSFLLAFLGFALLIILHELGHFFAAKAVGMRVERFSLFFPPLLGRVRRGETEYAIGAIPLGGYVKITGMNPAEEIPPAVAHRAYYRQPVWKRIVVIGAGPAVNIVLAFLILWILLWSNGVGEATGRVERVTAEPAAGALRPGDQLVSVDGVTGSFADLREQISTHRCAEEVDGCSAETPAVVVVRNDGEERTLRLAPVYDAAQDNMFLGFQTGSEVRPIGPLEAADESVYQLWFFTSKTVETIAGIFEADKRKEISGVVGSYEVTRQTIELDTERAVYLLAIISLSLGVINLFPFLPLDGGHIFWALAEKVRGRAIPFSVMERAGFVGFVLVIALFMIGLTNDVGRLTGDGFGVR
ncbi:MAG TPA: M50 family metallopeptidase [Solirubrobacteraceae bacterium]|nr:M50 family metallopeptidase [Solirubrobacteraceae bacterium]